MSRTLRLLPLGVVALLLAALVWRLAFPGDTTVRSTLTGKPVPAFKLPPAIDGKPALTSTDLATGEPQLVNIFASWCVPCIAEAPILAELRRRGVPMVGIAIRDRPEDVARFLAAHGDPFQRIGADLASQVQIALGSSGVPETFIVDGEGIIRHQHVGPLVPGDVPAILEEMEKAR